MMKLKKFWATLEHYGKTEIDGEQLSGAVTLRKEADCMLIDIDVQCIPTTYGYAHFFERYQSVMAELEAENTTGLLAQSVDSPYWTSPAFADTELPENHQLQYVLLQNGESYTFILPIADSHYIVSLHRGADADCLTLQLNTHLGGVTHASGTAAVITCDKDPYKAVGRGFAYATKHELIATPLRRDKAYPEMMEYLGWCTWDAFYHDVSEEKILRKMEEFKAKNIPVRWVLIDDGWSEVNDNKLASYREDKAKFPHGLKHTVEVLKNTYGVRAVGVWHAATGYWGGIAFQNEDTLTTSAGYTIPDGYSFFSKWHKWLKAQGVDFVKVDVQGNLLEFLKGTPSPLAKHDEIIEGLERSVKEHFSCMINCMGLGSLNMFSHRYSVLMRNSGDFLPKEENALEKHVKNNVYNAVFNSNLYYCDYDMWWSKHFEAKQNAVLRYISGGPFYLSDAAENSDAALMHLFVDENGKINRFDNAALPTQDCLFGCNGILKVFNTRGTTGAVAVFAFGGGTAKLSAADFGGSGRYTVRDFFSGESKTLQEGEAFTVTLTEHDVKLFLFDKTN